MAINQANIGQTFDMANKVVTPRVSVIVPAYNAGEHLECAFDSVLAQTMPHLEVIVVDDASNDNTLEVAYGVAARDSRVQVLRNDRTHGLAANRNRAIDASARGKAAHRDCRFEPQEGLRSGRDLGHHSHRFGYPDCSQDNCSHLRFLHQSYVGTLSREDQRIVALNLTTHI